MTQYSDNYCQFVSESRPFLYFLSRPEGLKSISLSVNRNVGEKKQKRSLKKIIPQFNAQFKTSSIKQTLKKNSIFNHSQFNFSSQTFTINEKCRENQNKIFFIEESNRSSCQKINETFYPKKQQNDLHSKKRPETNEAQNFSNKRIQNKVQPQIQQYKINYCSKVQNQSQQKKVVIRHYRPIKINFVQLQSPMLQISPLLTKATTNQTSPSISYMATSQQMPPFNEIELNNKLKNVDRLDNQKQFENYPNLKITQNKNYPNLKITQNKNYPNLKITQSKEFDRFKSNDFKQMNKDPIIKQTESIDGSDSQHSDVLLSGFDEIIKDFDSQFGEKKTQLTHNSQSKMGEYLTALQLHPPANRYSEQKKRIKHQLSIGLLKPNNY